QEGRVLAVGARRSRERPELVIVGAGGDDRALYGVAARIRDRPGQLVAVELYRMRRLVLRVAQSAGDDDRALRPWASRDVGDRIADVDPALRRHHLALLGRCQPMTVDGRARRARDPDHVPPGHRVVGGIGERAGLVGGGGDPAVDADLDPGDGLAGERDVTLDVLRVR